MRRAACRLKSPKTGAASTPDALKRKAVEKGLLTPEAASGMSEEAAFQLVFLPGLIDRRQGNRRFRPRSRDGCCPQ